jgi:hypothetical protein
MNYQEHFKIELSEIEIENFKSGYWNVEDFYVEDGELQTSNPLTIELCENPLIVHKVNLSEIDCIFISYDEPNAEHHWADLLSKAPWAKRVHGVKGSDAAHKAAAELSSTERFITVDGDNIVDPKFFDIEIDLLSANLVDKQLSWCGKNIINGLVYGNGGLKCWTKDFVLNMKTHEAAADSASQLDFCWNNQYKQMANLHSVSYNNASPLQAWRAGFREGVKMTLNNGVKQNLINPKHQIVRRNYQRLLIWCNIGADIDQGLWAMYGARLGCYMTNCTDWDYLQVRDFDYLNNMFEELSYNDPLEQIVMLGKKLKSKLGMPMHFFSPEQSRFFKDVWVNPPRYDHMVKELDTNWDLLDL